MLLCGSVQGNFVQQSQADVQNRSLKRLSDFQIHEVIWIIKFIKCMNEQLQKQDRILRLYFPLFSNSVAQLCLYSFESRY